MSPTLFILTITVYLVSSVASLVSSFFAKNIRSWIINTLITLHVLALVLWFVFKNNIDSITNPGNSNYLFLAFFCSGIIVSGVLLRKTYPLFVKIYFSLFLLSLGVFIVSPSRVLGFISSGNLIAISPKRFQIKENYYFVEQQSIKSPAIDSMISYKVIREMGFFHKTLTRDVLLPGNTDSVSVMDFQENKNIFVKIYFLKNNLTDSLNVNVPLVLDRDSSNIITRKKF